MRKSLTVCRWAFTSKNKEPISMKFRNILLFNANKGCTGGDEKLYGGIVIFRARNLQVIFCMKFKVFKKGVKIRD